MPYRTSLRRVVALGLATIVAVAIQIQPILAQSAPLCADEQPTPQIPTDLARCAELDPIVRKPSALPLREYELALNEYLAKMCHRNTAAGWAMDKTVRDTGPFTATYADGKWTGRYFGTHAPVLVWYSPDMLAWLKANRPEPPAIAPATPAPIPDGAMMVKEMYAPSPASACRIDNLLRLRPDTNGTAVMVRDSAGGRDGWFWGGFIYKGWKPDWPPPASNSLAVSGLGMYCTNCHASARDNQTFASLNNIKGEPGTYLNFLSQDFFLTQSGDTHTAFSQILEHQLPVLQEAQPVPRALLKAGAKAPPPPPPGINMPSASFDHVWVPGDGPNPHSTFVTSDQCVGCHSSGGTGLQFDMSVPGQGALANKLVNISPYQTWRTSPMGLAGRDPVFFAQLASETQTFHPQVSPKLQDVCLGCHGVLGQRQAAVDQPDPKACPPFLRPAINAVPYPPNNATPQQVSFGALARDGVSCTTCHRIVLGQAANDQFLNTPQNQCVARRQAYLNADNKGFARTFTGSFVVGAVDQITGPFEDPKKVPMQHALGLTPVQDSHILDSELCGSCHTVHLPVLQNGQELGHTYEQTTYPEWAFSAYRTGDTADGKLPFGAGARAQSCQGCHLPSTDAQGKPFHSKIAGIQERSTFPEFDNGLPASDIDLRARDNFGRHTLVGLNVFLIDMAAQFSDVLGVTTLDPMLGAKAVPPLDVTRQAMLDQASNSSVAIRVSAPRLINKMLVAEVVVSNKTGHKFPSGVGFRRAFIDFRVLNSNGRTLWESGGTDAEGRIVDQRERPIAGEEWWKPDCSARLNPGSNAYQPHYQLITRRDQVQIYQELVTAPPPNAKPGQCGPMAKPAGPLTTSFLSICAKLKDNRLLPDGFLSLQEREKISNALGAGDDMAEDTSPVGTGNDPDYVKGGGDTVRYQIPLADIDGSPARVEAVLYYQATPPFFLQDRRCTATGVDRDRLAYLTGALNLAGTREEEWKLRMVSSGLIGIAQ